MATIVEAQATGASAAPNLLALAQPIALQPAYTVKNMQVSGGGDENAGPTTGQISPRF
jgi:hypothetical protein